MFYVNPFFTHQVTVVAVNTNEKTGTQEIVIFQALGNPAGFMPELIAGTGNKMEPVVRPKMLKNSAPKKNIVFILYMYRSPAFQHFCIHSKTFCGISKMYLFIFIFNTHTKHRKKRQTPGNIEYR